MGMSATMHPQRRADLLTSVDRPSPAKAQLLTAREKREECARLLRLAIARRDLKLAAVCDKDHGQLSREIDDKEKLSVHEIYARWSEEVQLEFVTLWAVKLGAQVERTIRIKETA